MYKSEHIITSRHYLVMSITAFTIGILLATAANTTLLKNITDFALLSALFLFALVIAFKISFRKRNFHYKPLFLPLLLVIFLLLGIFRVVIENRYFPDFLPAFTESGAWLTGTVESEPKVTQNNKSCSFEMTVYQINDCDINPEHTIIYIKKERGLLLSEGDQICCWTQLQYPRNKQRFPYNYETYLKGKNIHVTGYARNINPATFTEPFSVTNELTECGNIISNKITSAVDRLMTPGTKSAILKGIIVGDKTDFSDSLYEQFSYAGLSHTVAVSGMHLSILFSAMTVIFSIGFFRKRTLTFVAIPIIIIFAATAKFTPSVCRAGIMIIMMLTANIFGKRYSPINALFLSLGIILFVSPYSIYSQSLTLSFLATLGILVYFKYFYYFAEKLTKRFSLKNKCLDRIFTYVIQLIITSFSISLSVTISTAYFSVLFFGTVSFAQFLTNIWIIPTVTLVFCLGYLMCLFNYILPPLSILLTYPLDFLLWIISSTARTFGKPIFTFHLANNDIPWKYAIHYLAAAILIYFVLKTFYDYSTEKDLNTSQKQYVSKEPYIPKL